MNIGWFLLIGLLPCIIAMLRPGKIIAYLAILYLIPFFGLSLSLIHPFSFEPLPWSTLLNIEFAFQLNPLNKLFLFLISGIGMLVFGYAISYYYNHPAKLTRLCVLLQFFTISMIMLILADNIIILFIAWELTTLTSFLLIQFYYHDEKARHAAFQGMLITVMGGLALLCGFILLHTIFNTWSLQAMISNLSVGEKSPTLLAATFILLLLGTITKSAQFPFYFWLPGAMKAPTPVSAFLHSATMVNAGIYLFARLHPLFFHTSYWYPTLAAIGLTTMLVAGFLALIPNDLKAILAYTTVFALGSMFYLLGGNNIEIAEALVAFLVAHAFYKAVLFMTVGVIDQRYHTRNIEQLAGIARESKLLAITIIIGTMSMAGLPPFFGFFAKELIYEAKLAAEAISWPMIVFGFIASMLTAAASFKILIRLFKKNQQTTTLIATQAMPYGYVMPLLLAIITIIIGFIPYNFEIHLLDPAVITIIPHPNAGNAEPSTWRAWPISITLSLLTVTGGFVFYWFKKPLIAFLKKQKIFLQLDPSRLLQNLISSILSFATWVTRFTQDLSLSKHLIISSTTLALFTGIAFYFGHPSYSTRLSHPVFLPICLLFVLGGIGLLISKNFIAAITSLSVIGLSLALFFILFGAPDVAMTQLLIEILTIIIIAIAFRQNKTIFSNKTSKTYHFITAIIAIAVGITISLSLFTVVNLPINNQLSDYFINNSLNTAQGKNVVNVILVDFRAYDTLGESLVVVAAAIGIATLLKLKKTIQNR